MPSRLIGHRDEARVFADVVTVPLAGVDKAIETMPRLRGDVQHASTTGTSSGRS